MPNVIEKRVCIKASKAQKNNIIEGELDDYLDVYYNSANGWSQVKNLRTGAMGWFPTNCTRVVQVEEEKSYSYTDDYYSYSDEPYYEDSAREVKILQEIIEKTSYKVGNLYQDIKKLKTTPIQSVDYKYDAKDEMQLLDDESKFLRAYLADMNAKAEEAEAEIKVLQDSIKKAEQELDKERKNAQSTYDEQRKREDARMRAMQEQSAKIAYRQQELAQLEKQLYAKELVTDDAVEYMQLKREVYGLLREKEAREQRAERDYAQFVMFCKSHQKRK